LEGAVIQMYKQTS